MEVGGGAAGEDGKEVAPMTKKRWRDHITQCCKDAGTYKPYFDDVIDTLAEILYKRDRVQAAFRKMGGDVLVEHVNKGGNKNLELHPALKTVNDLNRDALSYWRDLGLTPAALRKLNEQAFKVKEKSPFSLAIVEALSDAGA